MPQRLPMRNGRSGDRSRCRAALDAVAMLAEIPAADSWWIRPSFRALRGGGTRESPTPQGGVGGGVLLALTGTNARLTSALGMVDDMDNFEEFVRTSEYSGAAWRAPGRWCAASPGPSRKRACGHRDPQPTRAP